MNKNATKRDFIPNIDTANEEIERLDARIAELEGNGTQRSATPKAEPPKCSPTTKQGLCGFARTAEAFKGMQPRKETL